jgi:hypothetical protein
MSSQYRYFFFFLFVFCVLHASTVLISSSFPHVAYIWTILSHEAFTAPREEMIIKTMTRQDESITLFEASDSELRYNWT